MNFLAQRINKRSNGILRCVSTGCTLLFCLVGWTSPLLGDWRDDVDYTKLVNRLSTPLPNGAGVPISLVEATAPGSNAYFPNTSHAEFGSLSDPSQTAVNFIDGSGGQANGNSSHAFDQAIRIFGNTTSVAPAANEVTVYEANDYLTDILKVNRGSTRQPEEQDFRVQNFSWIGTFATPDDGTPDPTITELNKDREALRRFDFTINRDNITAVVGLHLNTEELPSLFAHSYNAIALGRISGVHSTGLTHLANYGVGRSKPDLVAPEASTSTATSITSSVAAFLHSSDTVLGTNAVNSETMKAILLAGATKEEFPTWSQIDAGGQWHPLDDTYGAGELNLYNSYLVTLSGEANGSTGTPSPVASHGWDYQTIQPGAGNEVLYDFVIPVGSSAAELSVVLTWNAEINSPFTSGDPIVADLNLEIVDSNGATVDLNTGDAFIDGLSQSDVDNVEHIYLTDLAAGTYTLKVSSEDLASDYGLAWRTSTLFDTFSADFDEDGDVDGSDFFAWQLGHGTLVNATHAAGDADGDGDVDGDDLAIFESSFSTGTPPLIGSFISVPEPAAWVLIVTAMWLIVINRRLRLSRAR